MPPTFQVMLRPQARRTEQRLTQALIAAAAGGERTPCSQPEIRNYWTSEHQKERALACPWCKPCPVISECRDAAEARREGGMCMVQGLRPATVSDLKTSS
jgi:hypothetical protein